MSRPTALILPVALCAALLATPTLSADPASGPTSSPAATSDSPGPDAPVEPVASDAPVLPSTGPLAWRRLRPTGGPSAREDHTWTLAPDGDAAYLFGGRDGSSVHGDLWRFDLVADAWEPVEPEGDRPGPRFGHSAAWVPGVGLVVFAGQRGTDFFNDLWAFDPETVSWRELPARGARPAPRYGSCAGVGPDGRLWISHGFTFRGRFDDTRAYDFARGAWRDVTPAGRRPSARCLHECFWAADGRFVLHGGQTNEERSLGDLWARTPTEGWARLPDPPAAARRLSAVTTAGPDAWIHGGAARDGSPLDDLWRVDRETLEWHRVAWQGTSPPPRASAAIVADPAGGRLLLVGGEGRRMRRDDLWQLAPVVPAREETDDDAVGDDGVAGAGDARAPSAPGGG
jgi:hypothetical protein